MMKKERKKEREEQERERERENQAATIWLLSTIQITDGRIKSETIVADMLVTNVN